VGDKSDSSKEEKMRVKFYMKESKRRRKGLVRTDLSEGFLKSGKGDRWVELGERKDARRGYYLGQSPEEDFVHRKTGTQGRLS